MNTYPVGIKISIADMSGLTRAREALNELEAKCCEPSRSPRMAAVSATLDEFETRIAQPLDDDAGEQAVALLEDAGAQIGALQVLCCAPARMPLYADFLEGLMQTQRALNRSLGKGH